MIKSRFVEPVIDPFENDSQSVPAKRRFRRWLQGRIENEMAPFAEVSQQQPNNNRRRGNRMSVKMWAAIVSCNVMIFYGCSETGTAAPNERKRPNVVLVMADDQGWGDMAYAGHPELSTPNFDRASAVGLRFDRFYAAAPVCSPTRASVLTGRHPNRSGVFKWGHPLRPQEITIAETLRANGYATAHFGKWHLGSVRHQSPVHPGRHGFDFWVSAPNFFDNDPILCHQGRAVQHYGESSLVTAEAAIEWISGIASYDLPFFAVVWFGSPHVPHQALDQDRGPYLETNEKRQHFYGEITGMDRAFGKLRVALEDLKLRENTILWYCSDNGALPQVGSAGEFRGRKGKVYDGGLLVPSFMEWPARIKDPRAVSMRCNSSDILPTLLNVLDIPQSDGRVLDGISLVELIDGSDAPRPEPMGFWDYPAPGMIVPSAKRMAVLLKAQSEVGGDLLPTPDSVDAARLPTSPYPSDFFPGHAAWINGDWKLHRLTDEQRNVQWELYNLNSDPRETSDLAATKPSLVQRLNDELEAWLRSVVASLNGNDYIDM